MPMLEDVFMFSSANLFFSLLHPTPSLQDLQFQKTSEGNSSCDEDSNCSLSPEQPVNQECPFGLQPLLSPLEMLAGNSIPSPTQVMDGCGEKRGHNVAKDKRQIPSRQQTPHASVTFHFEKKKENNKEFSHF